MTAWPPDSVQSLIHGVIGMTMTRIKLLAAGVIVAAGFGLDAVATAQSPVAPPPTPIAVPPKGEPTVKGAPGADKPDDEAAVAAHIKALSAADNETRAAAAAALRRIVAKYPSKTVDLPSQDGGEATWQKKVDEVEAGMTKAEVLKRLPAFVESPEGGEIGSGDNHIVMYRLDYHWIVRIHYRNPDKVIKRPVLIKRALRVHAAPPKDFTGTWTTWHVNGQKGYKIQYKDGRYDGTYTSYHDNGRKSTEQQYANHVAHGAGAGWEPDGEPAYTLQYRDGKQDGIWTHWHANGNKRSEETYADGKLNGRKTYWHESGLIGSVNDYADGVKNGLEASWAESGELHYKRVLANGKVVKVLK